MKACIACKKQTPEYSYWFMYDTRGEKTAILCSQCFTKLIYNPEKAAYEKNKKT